eukprot:g5102.t1
MVLPALLAALGVPPSVVGSATLVLGTAALLPDGSLTHPHRAFWRVSYALLLWYAAALAYLAWLPGPPAVRDALRFLDDTLGEPLPERAYGTHCDMSWENVEAVLFDIFVLPHAFGWICGTALLRDVRLAWVLSVLFELLEVTFTHWQPNFDECWWDHVLVDVLVCNAFGIYAGKRLLRRSRVAQFDWLGFRAAAPGTAGAGAGGGVHAGPSRWLPLVLRSWRRYCAVLLLLGMVSLMMLNAFFLKSALWIPSEHSANVARLLLWYCTAPYAMHEYYHWCVGGSGSGGSGGSLWRTALCSVVILLEAGLCTKFRRESFAAPFPGDVVFAWQCVGAALVACGGCVWLLDDDTYELARERTKAEMDMPD